jgi:hypothetical protein
LAQLTIPRQFVEPLILLSNLPDETFEQLSKVIDLEKPIQDRNTLVQQFASELDDNEASEVKALVTSLISLANVRAYRHWTIEQFVDALSNSPQLKDLTEAQHAKLRERTPRILSSRTLTTIARAGRVLTDHERVFHRARLHTDIRPVFRDDSDIPSGAVLIYTLRIDAHKLGAQESFSFALDDKDLRRLKEMLDRAIEESNGVKRLLESTGVTSLKPFEEEE